MTAQMPREATIEDLYRVTDDMKAELVCGEIVLMPPTGEEPGYAGDAVTVSLWQHVRQTQSGRAVGDNKGFHVSLPNRKSFSPTAAFYTGPRTGMKIFNGAPNFAVEVRSEERLRAGGRAENGCETRGLFRGRYACGLGCGFIERRCC